MRADTLRDLTREMEFSPGELDEVESRLDILYRLKKKYGATVEEMLQYLDKCRKELDEIQFADDTIARLTKELDKARKEADRTAQALSQQRRKAAEKLEKRVQEELRQLDMPKVRFQVEFSPIDNQWGLDETGMDQVPVFDVGQCGRGPQAHSKGGLGRRVGPHHVGTKKCTGSGRRDRHPGL